MDSDPDIEFIEKDSGMSSLGGSKDETPERRPDEILETSQEIVSTEGNKAENFDDEPDETLTERIWGLTEMFPEPVRNGCETITYISAATVKAFYQFTCNASWIFFTSSMILFAPVIFETERAQMEEMQRTQQKQVLLGPGSAGLGTSSTGMPALPPMSATR